MNERQNAPSLIETINEPAQPVAQLPDFVRFKRNGLRKEPIPVVSNPHHCFLSQFLCGVVWPRSSWMSNHVDPTLDFKTRAQCMPVQRHLAPASLPLRLLRTTFTTPPTSGEPRRALFWCGRRSSATRCSSSSSSASARRRIATVLRRLFLRDANDRVAEEVRVGLEVRDPRQVVAQDFTHIDLHRARNLIRRFVFKGGDHPARKSRGEDGRCGAWCNDAMRELQRVCVLSDVRDIVWREVGEHSQVVAPR